MSVGHNKRILAQKKIERYQFFSKIVGFFFFISGAVLLFSVALIAMTHWSRDFAMSLTLVGFTAGSFLSLLLFGALRSSIDCKISEVVADLDRLRRGTYR